MDFFSPSVAVAGYFTQHVITCSRVESLILGAVRTLRQCTSILVSGNGFQEEIKDRLPSGFIVHGSTTIMTALRHSSSGSGSHVHWVVTMTWRTHQSAFCRQRKVDRQTF
jgi:hypothetical protein